MKLVNHAGSPIELFWVDIYTNIGELIKQTTKPLRNTTATHINSYDTHKFVVKFLDPKKTSTAEFVKGPKEEEIFVTLDPETNELKIIQKLKTSEIMEKINLATSLCQNLTGSEFSNCVANGIVEDVTRISDSKTTMTSYRDLMASRLRNYTCADETMNTTEPISSYQLLVDNKEYTIDVFLNMTTAKIWKVDNFISEEECGVLMEHGRSRLTRATVAAEDGSSVVSEHRKANQASYNLHKHNPETDPLWNLFQRVLGVTNYHAGFDLKPPGQEDFTIIQYNVEDQYTPHCDGTCDNSMHIPTGRVATAVLYCKVADKGGSTTFTKADVFVKPTVGTATFFSYMGPDGRMDDGYTEHSGCPVLEGEKWITTVWMRDGVDDAHPWTSYDPNGVKMLDGVE
eukprot:CAMPEP_0170073820 /NCGR_PEP_ID=MMETSP0019_2-20121128/11196_1 /TAXON_ID=98059 /ORGANISM="Dinobryon sp., Strain UTEXLB2267" /LENGTH=398 /DNA_ID=CAMNT_0010283649 /DNA_START=109 /DNA_END=1305 /DNA_ORIENTATION=-